MRISRSGWARVVLAATLAAAAWLYTYSVTTVVQYVDANGHRFHPSQVTTEQPWWSPYATVALVVVGGRIALGLLPKGKRFAALLGRDTGGTPRHGTQLRVGQTR